MPQRLQDLVLQVFAQRETPVDVETLYQTLRDDLNWNGSYRHMLNLLAAEDRFVRTSKTTWSLKEWGLPQYRTVAQALVELIEEAGGSINRKELLDQIETRYNVRRGTAATYIRALPAIEIDNAYNVKLRETPESYSYEISPDGNPGVYHLGDRMVVLLIRVDSGDLRGSGRRLPAEIAAMIGLQPGSTVRVSGPEGKLKMSFPMMSAAPVLSSIRPYVQKHNCREGDYLSFTLHTSERVLIDIRVIHKEELTGSVANRNGWDTAARLTGTQAEEGLAGLAASLKCAPNETLGKLERRADPLVPLVRELI